MTPKRRAPNLSVIFALLLLLLFIYLFIYFIKNKIKNITLLIVLTMIRIIKNKWFSLFLACMIRMNCSVFGMLPFE